MTARSFAGSQWGVVSVYVALAIVLTWPLFPSMATLLPHGANDIWQNYWNFWWWREALFELGTNPYWTDLLFHPYGTSLVLHTHSTFNQIIALPINLAVGPIAALNFATLLGFILSGISAHHLAYEVSGSRAGAYVAGLVFAFFPHHLEQSLEHLNLSSLQFLPWVALYGLRIIRGGSRRDAVLFGIVFALNALACWHYALFAFFILPWIWLVEWLGAEDRRASARAFVGSVLVSILAFAVVMLPFFVAMYSQAMDLDTYAKSPIDKGIDLAFLFVPSDQHPLLGGLTEGFYAARRTHAAVGSQAYLGYTVLALAGVALVRRRRDRAVIGWALVFGCSFVFALGAHPTFAGRELGITLPHDVFQHIPILKGLRVANRFIVISMLALAVLAAIGVAVGEGRRKHLALVCFALISFEYLWLPYPMQEPDFSPVLDRLGVEAEGAVLSIPFTDHSMTALNLAYQTRHKRPIAGGYISVSPRGEAALGRDAVVWQLSGLEPPVTGRIDIDHLRRLGFSHVALHMDRARESLREGLERLPPSANFYQRRPYDYRHGISRARLEYLSRLFEAEVGPPAFEDSRVRVFDLGR
jgi:hypothetical protein